MASDTETSLVRAHVFVSGRVQGVNYRWHTQRKALEITVKLDSGQTLAIVQEADETFNVGDRIRVLTASDGTKRVRH